MLLITVIAGLLGIVFGTSSIDEVPKIESSNTSFLDKDRIIGGRTAVINEAPYLTSLQNSGIHFCGGSIIKPRWILTAAHCIEGVKKVNMNSLTVRVGSTLWSSGGQVRNIIAMKSHPKYNPVTKEADIGLLLLGSSITYNSAVKAIELADGVPTDGKIGIIGGWGVTDEQGFIIPTMLKYAEVTSISRKNCTQDPWKYREEIHPSMICAYGKGMDACQGDSGGPYASKSSNKLWGVVSWGHGCAREGYPGVFTAVVAFKKWITSTISTI